MGTIFVCADNLNVRMVQRNLFRYNLSFYGKKAGRHCLNFLWMPIGTSFFAAKFHLLAAMLKLARWTYIYNVHEMAFVIPIVLPGGRLDDR